MELETTTSEGVGSRARGAPREVWAKRNVVTSAAAQLRSAGVLSSTLEGTIRVLAAGAWPCASGRFVNAVEASHLAGLLGCTGETLRQHVRALEGAGWVRDVTMANGARTVVRGRRFGIDLTPLLDRAGEAESAARGHREELSAMGEERQRLRQLKGRLRRVVTAAEREGRIATAEAVAALAALPRRFHQLGLDALRRLAAAAAAALAALGRASEAHETDVRGHAKLCDRAPADLRPTNTSEERSMSRGPAGEDSGEARGTPESSNTGRGEGGVFDLRATELLALLPREMRETVEELYGGDERTLWEGVDQAAQALWCDAGGDARTRETVMAGLGQRQGAALLLLVHARTGRGGVRDMGAYAVGCARRAAVGTFMWGAGARAALTRQEGRVPI
jgi:hypothetical protein